MPDNMIEPASIPAVWAAITSVMAEVTNIPKTGEMRNKQGNIQYNFVPSSELRARFGKAFRNHALVLQSRDLTATFEGKPVSGANGSTVWTTAQITITYLFTSLVDGSTLEFAVAGEGRDSSDKATAKAMTMALKSALSQAFMLATDDEEPDAQRPEIVQEQRYAPPPPDNRTPEQRAAQEAYERRRAAQNPDAAQRAEATATAPHPTGQPVRQPEPGTRLSARRPEESDEQYLARLRTEQASQEDYNQVVREMNGRAAQVHPARPVQASTPDGDPMQQAEQMLADQLGAQPADEIGKMLVTTIGQVTRERMNGQQHDPRDAAQRERASKAVQAAVNADTLDKVNRVVQQAQQEGLLELTIDDGKMVAAMLKACRDSRLAAGTRA